MSIVANVGLLLSLILLVFLAPFLVYLYARKEFVYTGPYFLGLTSSLLVYGGLAYLFIYEDYFSLGEARSFLGLSLAFILFAFFKALVGEASKAWLGHLVDNKAYPWRFYLPLGLGYGQGFSLIIFAPLVLELGQGLMSGGGLSRALSQLLIDRQMSGLDPFYMCLFIGGLIYGETATAILNGMKNNKKRWSYGWLARLAAFLFTLLALYPYPQFGYYGLVGLLLSLTGLFTSVYYRDAFSKFVQKKRDFRRYKK